MSKFSNDLLLLRAITSCFMATKLEESNKNKRITKLHYSTIWSSALDKTIFVFYVILVQIRCIFSLLPEQLMAVWIVVVSACSYVQFQGRRLIKMSVGTGTRKKHGGGINNALPVWGRGICVLSLQGQSNPQCFAYIRFYCCRFLSFMVLDLILCPLDI